jgi:very-short-patch-repair endonuclease
MHHDNTPTLCSLISFARRMRKHPTKSEALLFGQLRKRKLGVRFRRQHVFPLGYIVDLYAPCAKLVIEVDGGFHLDPERARADAVRQAELEAVYGVRFVRVSAELVERDVLAAVEIVRAALRAR